MSVIGVIYRICIERSKKKQKLKMCEILLSYAVVVVTFVDSMSVVITLSLRDYIRLRSLIINDDMSLKRNDLISKK